MHSLGQTRSVNRRDHLLHTPDAFVRTPLPGLTGGLAIVHTSPQAGAGFTQMTVEFEPGATLTEGPGQRFCYVLEGELSLAEPEARVPHRLSAGSFAFLPQSYEHLFTAETQARVALVEKHFQPLAAAHAEALAAHGERDQPYFLVGREQDIFSAALNSDEALQVRSLLPASPAFDFACNTMEYQPGASLSQVEVHVMEHGLLMLEGGGIYRLGDDWYPTEAGDFFWMAPFCPQWFGALGKKPAKYLIYKNFHRHPLG